MIVETNLTTENIDTFLSRLGDRLFELSAEKTRNKKDQSRQITPRERGEKKLESVIDFHPVAINNNNG